MSLAVVQSPTRPSDSVEKPAARSYSTTKVRSGSSAVAARISRMSSSIHTVSRLLSISE